MWDDPCFECGNPSKNLQCFLCGKFVCDFHIMNVSKPNISRFFNRPENKDFSLCRTCACQKLGELSLEIDALQEKHYEERKDLRERWRCKNETA